MKYANDPFWIRLRWLLFILFWALWVAMLAGAIVIIVMAPKCAEKKGKAETFYELNLKNFAKDGKLAGNVVLALLLPTSSKHKRFALFLRFGRTCQLPNGPRSDFPHHF